MEKYDQVMYHALEARAMKDNHEILCWDRQASIEENAAYQDFVERFAERFREYYESHLEELTSMCVEHCRTGCKGAGNCDIEKETLHAKLRLIDK